jgi:3-dehydroquinate dehydratase/shikimate dehydrogenase
MSRPLLVETVTASTTAELCRRRDAVTGADLVELRLDSVSDPSVAGALAGRRGPVIVTCRPMWEGGHFAGSEEERLALLTDAYVQGAEYVDVEWRAHFHDLVSRGGGRRVVLSAHDFDAVPNDLASRAHAMRSTGAEIVKLAVRMTRLSDCVPLLELGSHLRQDGLVLIGLGEYGLATRVLAARFGSSWMYSGGQSEAGQVSTASLLEDYGFHSLSESTDVYGLAGRPVAHSVSPAMFNAAFQTARLDAVYLPLQAADAGDFVAFGKAIGIKGASVTIPFKMALFDSIDEAYSVSRRIGAVNTIRVVDGRWLGGNTDATGFLSPLNRHIGLTGQRVAIIGAGGAARSVAIALAASSVNVRIHARDRRRAQDAASLTSAAAGEWPPAPGSWDLLVNCTPVGMYPRVDETPLPADHLTGRCVYDLIYNPPETRLLREAAKAGCETIGGLEMLVTQAQEQFHWWMGARPPTGIMREAALKRLAEFIRDEDHVV